MNKDLIDDQFMRFAELPQKLWNLNHNVMGCCLSYEPRKEGVFETGGVNWHSFNLGRHEASGTARYFFKALNIARTFKPDVILSFSDSPYLIMGQLMASILGVKHIMDFYDNFETFESSKLPGILSALKFATRRADGVLVFCASYLDYLREHYHPDGNFYYLANGVDTERFRRLKKQECRDTFGMDQDANYIGYIGAINAKRDIDTAIKGFLELRKKYGNLRLVMAGPTDGTISIPNVPEITYLGNLEWDSIPKLVNAIDLAVLCYGETSGGGFIFPTKLFETMACQTPFVASNIGSLAKLLQHNQELLFTEGDTSSFVKVCEQQLQNPSHISSPVPCSWEEQALNLEMYLKAQLNN